MQQISGHIRRCSDRKQLDADAVGRNGRCASAVTIHALTSRSRGRGGFSYYNGQGNETKTSSRLTLKSP
jgi:hypothetical protein